MNTKLFISATVAATLLISGVAFAQATTTATSTAANPSLAVMVTTSASAGAGSTGTALGLITLDATHSSDPVRVAAIPVTFTFNGAAPSEFTNCSLRNVTNLGTALNTGSNALSALNSNGGPTTITLDTPIVVPAGSIAALALTCNVAAVTPTGSSITVGVTPSSVPATDASTGAAITPTSDTIAATGGTAPISGTIAVTSSGSGTAGTGTSGTPGTPNTGAGGNAPLAVALLLGSGLALFFGGRELARHMARA